MNPDNRAYGNDYVLALYAGLGRRVPPIWGYLQHGWSEHLVVKGHRHSSRWPVFCYSERQVIATTSRHPEVPQVIPIGAPFLYLQRLLDHEGGLERPPRRSGVVAYPGHHWTEDLSPEQLQEHVRLADLLLERHSREDVVVVLHWSDWSWPEIRAVYAARGVSVTTHGRPRDHEMFLLRQLHFLAGREEYVSNIVATSLMYAASLGLRVSVVDIGDPERPDPGQQAQRDNSPERHRELFPELHVAGGIGSAEALELGRAELGWRHLLEPAELREVLGWNMPARGRNYVGQAAKNLVERSRRLAPT